MTTYISEDFENFPTGWTTGASGGGTIVKSNAQKHGGSYSALVTSNGAASYAYGSKAVSFPATDYHVRIWIWIDDAVAANDINIFYTQGVAVDVLCSILKDGATWRLRNRHGTYDNVGTLSVEEWHQIDVFINRTTGKIHYYIDVVKQGGDWTPENNATPTTIIFGDVAGTTAMNGMMYYDDLLIDDAAEPSPPVAAGQHCCLDGLTCIVG